uniref:NadR/Ttd14 AAA domain-containing protein n=1 Tax=Strombidium rassoulzadegani TaxID=1082188 RepID=A0A7S3CU52_9SPIT|mmetsp:Transcript_9276/g.15607  ORF Transcript_9276/g.15607 Transcript_9276/m.15607 type:complete len:384 (+) Transcript_9276:384-1535(+)|eukprot:CAMPEP_0168616824 /NCGR_PEP_ID=MMETSP0449_2-20121227/5227_1 /TAXON_ID=1082188 /ORGANISM="Strombidium rassoulzadegani, Strain ras09" /LENGTH=383 /DNA_ID=CAMNT_0008657623 /DNA_START=335 /DNA_END=1486 /DNA_ORIENTATION=-
MLMKAGAMIDNKKLSDVQRENFQVQLMKTQMSLEDIIHNIALNSEDPSVILMDRGLMDTAGYSGWKIWDRILERTGWNNIELRDNRYDAVIHMITAADGCPEFYDNENVARYESVEEAVERDKALRSAYLGHNKLFFIGNQHDNGFEGKIQSTIDAVFSVIGFPTSIKRFRKFLVETRGIDFEGNESDVEIWGQTPRYEDYHGKVFKSSETEPFNSTQDNQQRNAEEPAQFNFVTNIIRHTYLKAPEDSIIFVRKRSGVKINNEPFSRRSHHFDYERRYMIDNQKIEKKRIMSGREYEDLLLNEFDEKRRQLKILRTSFMFENQYFQLETFTNIIGAPTFLLVESEDEHVSLPPYLKVLKDVSNNAQYSTHNMSRHDFEMSWD